MDTPVSRPATPPSKCPFAFIAGRRGLHGLLAMLGLGLIFLAVGAVVAILPPKPRPLSQLAAIVSYDLEAVRRGAPVPRAVVRRLDPGLGEIADTNARKDLFFRILLPLVLRENERRPSPLKKIPVSLALAQAAIESGWGTARFAVLGNALYGQRAYGGTGKGIHPEDGAGDFTVRAFETLGRSVSSYFRNLNGHPRYEELRRARKIVVTEGRTPGPFDLLTHLQAYSAEGAEYLGKIARVIRENRLEDFDRARLE